MKLGRRLGEGRTAEIFRYGDDRAIKLMREGFAADSIRVEFEKTDRASRVGAPGPFVHGIEVVAGRSGLVTNVISGQSVLTLMLDEPHEDWGLHLARLHARILTCPGTGFPELKVTLRHRIGKAPHLIPDIRASILDRLDVLPAGSNLLHGDFHPANVLGFGEEATVIDWGDAHNGPPAADIARTLWLTAAHAVPPEYPDRHQVVEVADRFRLRYLDVVTKLTGVDSQEVHDWMPPVAAARLVEGIESEVDATLEFLNRSV